MGAEYSAAIEVAEYGASSNSAILSTNHCLCTPYLIEKSPSTIRHLDMTLPVNSIRGSMPQPTVLFRNLLCVGLKCNSVGHCVCLNATYRKSLLGILCKIRVDLRFWTNERLERIGGRINNYPII